jgi:hypothetical protein
MSRERFLAYISDLLWDGLSGPPGHDGPTGDA